MRILFPALTLVAALALAGCAAPPPNVDKAAIEKAIRLREGDIAKAFSVRDSTTLASYYTSDAVFMSSFQSALKGNDAIHIGLDAMLKDPNLKLDFSADRIEISENGDMAIAQGTYHLTVSDAATKEPIKDHGSYVTLYRKQPDGAWKAQFDISTTEVPPPAPPPADPKKK